MPKNKQKKNIQLPKTEELKKELKRTRFKEAYFRTVRHAASVLLCAGAIAVLISMLWLPVLKIHGTSMAPTLDSGDIVLAEKTDRIEPGDTVAFYYNNRILVKRVIAKAGDWVDIDEEGTVKVNGETLHEPYLSDKALGESNIEYPFQVPDGRLFVLGDQRSSSLDSRNTAIGTVADEQLVGKIRFRLWPLAAIGAP